MIITHIPYRLILLIQYFVSDLNVVLMIFTSDFSNVIYSILNQLPSYFENIIQNKMKYVNTNYW